MKGTAAECPSDHEGHVIAQNRRALRQQLAGSPWLAQRPLGSHDRKDVLVKGGKVTNWKLGNSSAFVEIPLGSNLNSYKLFGNITGSIPLD